MGSVRVRVRNLGRLSARGGRRLSPYRPVAVAVAARADRAEAFEAWRREVEHVRRIEREAEFLDVGACHARWAVDVSLRLVMLHEYARYKGHVDFLREAVDGVVGV
ncbi:mycothiol transferase [Micromonospora chersina]|uniref:mycothiol transferase n=1 Tax=Micromonospora chersina TaxID=47854 RepID=UPI003712E3F2